MLTEPTIDKLRGMRLGTMADAWLTQREQPKVHELDFDTRFGLLVDAEHLARDNQRLARALRAAKLRLPNACIEDIDFTPSASSIAPPSASSERAAGSRCTPT